MSSALRLFVVAMAFWLSSCATTRVVGPAASVATSQARQDARVRLLATHTDWGLEGRVAVSSNGQGGSARIDWQQSGARFDVRLSAPITRQSWSLTGSPGQARLEGLEGGPRHGTDAGLLLREAAGWDIPITSLASWLRGVAAPGSPASMTFGPGGQPLELVQDGWTITYRWPEALAPLAMPGRIEARRGTARVRLAVDRWIEGGASP